MLDQLCTWCDTSGVKINEQKSKFMHYSMRNTAITKRIFHCGSKSIERCQTYKYLDIMLNKLLRLISHQKQQHSVKFLQIKSTPVNHLVCVLKPVLETCKSVIGNELYSVCSKSGNNMCHVFTPPGTRRFCYNVTMGWGGGGVSRRYLEGVHTVRGCMGMLGGGSARAHRGCREEC